MIFAHLLQSASSLPTDSSALGSSISALKSSISALERSIKILEDSSPFWEKLLPWCTGVVAIGVALELWIIWREYRDDMQAWGRGIVLSPDRPSTRKLVVEVVSVTLITAGIIGELGTGIKITSINGALRSKNAELRSKSDQLLALVTQEAGDAETSARGAADAAARANAAADAAEEKATTANDKTDKLGAEVGFRRLTPDQREKIGRACAAGYSFAATKRIQIESYGMDGEGTALAKDISAALVSGKIYVADDFGAFIQSGGVDTGVLIFGPLEQETMMSCLQKALSNIGKLRDVTVNGERHVGNAVVTGNAVMSGNTQLRGGGGIRPAGPLPTGSPITILVGEQPAGPETNKSNPSTKP